MSNPDISIILGNREYQLHKNILSENSGYFKALFNFEDTNIHILDDKLINEQYFDYILEHFYNPSIKIVKPGVHYYLIPILDYLLVDESWFLNPQIYPTYIIHCENYIEIGSKIDDTFYQTLLCVDIDEFPNYINNYLGLQLVSKITDTRIIFDDGRYIPIGIYEPIIVSSLLNN